VLDNQEDEVMFNEQPMTAPQQAYYQASATPQPEPEETVSPYYYRSAQIA
jgi:hypothetical protein